MPVAPRKAQPKTPPPPTGKKRPAPDNDVDEPATKRAKTQMNGTSGSPSKGYTEVDGVLVVEDDAEDDVIYID